MKNTSKDLFPHLEAWWERRDIGRALFTAWLPEDPSVPVPSISELNDYWPSPEHDPDLDSLVAAQLKAVSAAEPVAEAMPLLCHHYGGRGTPMNMAWYLGGKPEFTSQSVWVEPVIDDWAKWPIQFDPNNHWVKLSEKLIHTQGRMANGRAIAWMPDFGDALTCFSMLRGTQNLLIDLLEQPDVIKAGITGFVNAFIAAHRHFHALYKKYWPGDTSVLLWAPDTTYMCQCDFSTMISPEMFRKFVLPELNKLSSYLKYMVWHLDGYEEVRHLPALLELPYLRGIQIQPGASRPVAVSETWLPICRRIQEAGKSLVVYAHTPEEFAGLAQNLDHAGLLIACTYSLHSRNEIENHLKMASR